MSLAVDCRGIVRRYGRFVAVADLSFAVEAGEILGVLGPNGAGKTTAIRVLTTILEPTEGTLLHRRSGAHGPERDPASDRSAPRERGLPGAADG